MRFYWERVEASRNFANKVWNASRFIMMNMEQMGEDGKVTSVDPASLTDADRALLRFKRQALHAAVLEFRHPFTGEDLRYESPFPWADFGLTR